MEENSTNETKPDEEKKSIVDKTKEQLGGIKETITEEVKTQADAIQLQSDVIKMQWDEFMGDIKDVEKMNIAFKKGEPVDLVKLDSLISKIDSFVENMKKSPGGFAIKVTVGPIQRQMHQWKNQIEKKQKETKAD